MATITDLQADIGLRTHDVGNVEVTGAQLITFINMAVRDITNSGWLIYLEENEALTEAAGTYSYAVPAGFAYLSQVRRENTARQTWDHDFDREAWRIGLDAGVATLFFNEVRWDPQTGARLKLIGQARPTVYTAGANTVDAGLEAILRERACYYSFQFLAAGRSEYAQWRQQQALLARAEYESLLSKAPQQFRMKPNSKYVPGR